MDWPCPFTLCDHILAVMNVGYAQTQFAIALIGPDGFDKVLVAIPESLLEVLNPS